MKTKPILVALLFVFLMIIPFSSILFQKSQATSGSIVQTCNNAVVGASMTCVLSSAVTAGDTIIFDASSNASANAHSMTDGLSSTNINVGSAIAFGAPIWTQFWYGWNGLPDASQAEEFIENVSGSSDTMTFPQSGGSATANSEVVGMEISGSYQLLPSSATYAQNPYQATGTGTSHTVAITSTTWTTHDLIVAFLNVAGCGGITSVTPPAGLTLAVSGPAISGGTTGCAQTWQSKMYLYTNQSWTGGASTFSFNVAWANSPSITEQYLHLMVMALRPLPAVTVTNTVTDTVTNNLTLTSTKTTTTTASTTLPVCTPNPVGISKIYTFTQANGFVDHWASDMCASSIDYFANHVNFTSGTIGNGIYKSFGFGVKNGTSWLETMSASSIQFNITSTTGHSWLFFYNATTPLNVYDTGTTIPKYLYYTNFATFQSASQPAVFYNSTFTIVSSSVANPIIIVGESTVTTTTSTTTVSSTTTTTTTGAGSSGAIVQAVDSGGHAGATTSQSATLPFTAHQYNTVLDAVYMDDGINSKPNTPTDNNSLTWHFFAQCGTPLTTHAVFLYYANMTHATGGITVTQTVNVSANYDFKLFSVVGINLGILQYNQTVCATGTAQNPSIPSTKFNFGFFTMSFTYWEELGSTSRTWQVSDPFSTFDNQQAQMVSKITSGVGTDYALAAFYPKYPNSSTTATWTASGGTENNVWAELVVSFPPAPVTIATSTSTTLTTTISTTNTTLTHTSNTTSTHISNTTLTHTTNTTVTSTDITTSTSLTRVTTFTPTLTSTTTVTTTSAAPSPLTSACVYENGLTIPLSIQANIVKNNLLLLMGSNNFASTLKLNDSQGNTVIFSQTMTWANGTKNLAVIILNASSSSANDTLNMYPATTDPATFCALQISGYYFNGLQVQTGSGTSKPTLAPNNLFQFKNGFTLGWVGINATNMNPVCPSDTSTLVSGSQYGFVCYSPDSNSGNTQINVTTASTVGYNMLAFSLVPVQSTVPNTIVSNGIDEPLWILLALITLGVFGFDLLWFLNDPNKADVREVVIFVVCFPLLVILAVTSTDINIFSGGLMFVYSGISWAYIILWGLSFMDVALIFASVLSTMEKLPGQFKQKLYASDDVD